MITLKQAGHFLIVSLFALAALCSCKRNSDNLPVARFSYSSVSTSPITVQFASLSTTPSGTATYDWDMGDGTYCVGEFVTHTYTQPGVYQVKLVQTPSTGAPDSVINVLNLASSQAASGTSNRIGKTSGASFAFVVSRSFVVTFTNQSTGADSYLWQFGNATSTTDSVTVVRKFFGSGIYKVTLSATNSHGTDTTKATFVL